MKWLIVVLIFFSSCNKVMYPKINHIPEYNNIDLRIENEPEKVIFSDKKINV